MKLEPDEEIKFHAIVQGVHKYIKQEIETKFSDNSVADRLDMSLNVGVCVVNCMIYSFSKLGGDKKEIIKAVHKLIDLNCW